MRYGSTEVLQGVSLRVQAGQVMALLGPNGAGKTTTIEILEGFRGRSAGKVTVLGVDPFGAGEAWRARVGIVLQSWRDHGKWRVREFLANQGSLYVPYSTPQLHRPWDADQLLAAVGLSEQAGRQVRHLSGGQRRRLDIASAWSAARSWCSWTNPPLGSTRSRVETSMTCCGRRPLSST